MRPPARTCWESRGQGLTNHRPIIFSTAFFSNLCFLILGSWKPNLRSTSCFLKYAIPRNVMKMLLRRWFIWIALAELAFSSRVSAENPPRLWDVRGASLFVDCCPAIDSNGVVYVTVSGSGRYADVSGGKLVAI